MTELTHAPWSIEQVDALNTYQRSGIFHPFTCPNRGDGKHYEYGGDQGELVATRDGWTCRDCGYTQTWAHAAMADKGAIERTRQALRDTGFKLPTTEVGERRDATMGSVTHDADPAAPAEGSEAVADTAADGSTTDAVGETTAGTSVPDGDSGEAADEEK